MCAGRWRSVDLYVVVVNCSGGLMPRSYSLTFEKSLDSLGDPQVATLLSIVEPENPNRAALGPSMLDRLGKGHDWGPWGNGCAAIRWSRT